jgi:hypothetical protein
MWQEDLGRVASFVEALDSEWVRKGEQSSDQKQVLRNGKWLEQLRAA